MNDDEIKKRLHIFPQRRWHHTAVLVGNRDGLLELRNAIDEALKPRDGYPYSSDLDANIGIAQVEPSDEEGYYAAVILHPDDCEDIDTAYWDHNGETRENSLIPNEELLMKVGAKLAVDRAAAKNAKESEDQE